MSDFRQVEIEMQDESVSDTCTQVNGLGSHEAQGRACEIIVKVKWGIPVEADRMLPLVEQTVNYIANTTRREITWAKGNCERLWLKISRPNPGWLHRWLHRQNWRRVGNHDVAKLCILIKTRGTVGSIVDLASVEWIQRAAFHYKKRIQLLYIDFLIFVPLTYEF